MIGARRRVLRADVEVWLESINDHHHHSNQVRHRNRWADRTHEAQLVEQRLVAEGF
jgi:hypothetical protein